MTGFTGLILFDGQIVPQAWQVALTDDLGPEARIVAAGGHAMAFLPGAHVPAEDSAAPFVLATARLDKPLSDLDDAAALALEFRQCDEACASRLEGDIAFAIWRPDRERLFLARSALGTRPIFYAEFDGGFAFATALRSLLALPFISHALDDDTICRVLSFDGRGPAQATYYKDIRRLPGGHTLCLERGVATLANANSWSSALRFGKSAQDHAAQARDLITNAVECRLSGGKTIAVHLSGGLDSSAIACIAARKLKQEGRRLLALCSVMPAGSVGPEADERTFIEAVLAQEDNIDPVWVETPLHLDPFAALPRWLQCLREPSYSNVTHIEEALGAAGKKHGVDVVLSGFGGDFFVSAPGAGVIAELTTKLRWKEALSEFWFRCKREDASWFTLLRQHLVGPLVRRRLLRKGETGCANPALIDRIVAAGGERSESSLPAMAGAYSHETMRFILAPGHLDRVLPGIHQVYAEEFGQDIRFPLLDARIINAVLATPPEQLQLGGWPRSLMRRAMVGILPELVRQRLDKGGAFDPALASRCAAARLTLEHWASDAEASCWNYVDRERFLRALSEVEPSGRENWRKDMFSAILTGGRIAKFIEWHERSQEARQA